MCGVGLGWCFWCFMRWRGLCLWFVCCHAWLVLRWCCLVGLLWLGGCWAWSAGCCAAAGRLGVAQRGGRCCVGRPRQRARARAGVLVVLGEVCRGVSSLYAARFRFAGPMWRSWVRRCRARFWRNAAAAAWRCGDATWGSARGRLGSGSTWQVAAWLALPGLARRRRGWGVVWSSVRRGARVGAAPLRVRVFAAVACRAGGVVVIARGSLRGLAGGCWRVVGCSVGVDQCLQFAPRGWF